MRGSTTIGFLTLAVASLSAPGQVRVVPLAATWQTPDSVSSMPANDPHVPNFVPMIVLEQRVQHNRWNVPPDNTPWRCVTTPELAAEDVAYTIEEALAADPGWIVSDGSNVVIMFRYFGTEGATGYAICPPIESAFSFFITPDDSIVGYPYDDPDYKHPFLKNATADPGTPANDPPMRTWTKRFCAHLKSTLSALNLGVDPSKFEYAFDSETPALFAGNDQSLRMLAFLADDVRWDWKVPGSPGWQPRPSHATNDTGMSLHQMYDAMVAATAGSPDPWPTNIFDQLNPGAPLGAQAATNRKFAIWYRAIESMVHEGVMYAAAYSVITDPDLGWANARCSNYHAANYDPLTAAYPTPTPTTTWFADKSLWTSGPQYPTSDPADWARDQFLTRALPRAFFDTQPAFVPMAPAGRSDRWLMLRRNRLCQFDSPELYQLNDDQWAGVPTDGRRGLWSLNPYVAAVDQYPALAAYPVVSNPEGLCWGNWNPLKETKAQLRLRMQRHDVESIINAGSGGNEVTLAPWVNEFIAVGYDQVEQRNAEREYRLVLGMLRAKNVPRLHFYPGPAFIGCPYGDNPHWCLLADWHQAFLDTRELVRRVWGPTIEDVDPVWGVIHPVEWHGEGTYPNIQPAALVAAADFTLLNSQRQDITVPVLACDECYDVGMQVVFRIPDKYALQYQFEINVEGYAPAGTTGRLLVQKASDGSWWETPTLEGPTTYSVDTADFPLGPGEPRPFRRTFTRLTGPEYVHAAGTHGLGYPHLVLRVKHTHVDPMATSWFDLVQVIPILIVSDGTTTGEESFAAGDLNTDGNLDAADVNLFVEGYVLGTALSDMNLDSQCDVADIDLFERSLLGGN